MLRPIRFGLPSPSSPFSWNACGAAGDLNLSSAKNCRRKDLIGESWEIVDRPEAQSIVRNGPLRGKTLHELWTQYRDEIFGDVPDFSPFSAATEAS